MGTSRHDALPDQLDVDVAIVGAGVSGLYCARRLAEHHPEWSVVVVERLDRTGGRLDTDLVHMPDHTTVREEEGGMRFNYGMVELMRLVHDLGLCDQVVPFPMASDVPGFGNTNRFLVRGLGFSVQEATAGGNTIWGEAYDLAPEERGLSPTDIVTNAYRNVLLANTGRGLDAEFRGGRDPGWWTTFRREFLWDGIPMADWQLWGLLRAMGHSEECIQMLSETIGFAGPFKSMANAGDAFQILADFPKVPTYFTFARGFSTLPDALRDDLVDNHGDQVEIVLGANVDAITRADDDFVLRVTEAPMARDATPWTSGGEARTIRASRVVMAVATAGAERLFVDSPALRDRPDARQLWEAIHSAMGMPLMKINLYFERPWWQDGQLGRPPVQFGPNFTDLPVNAVYPFYGEQTMRHLVAAAGGGDDATPAATDGPTTGPTTGATAGAGGSATAGAGDPAIEDVPAALTIYCDFDNTNFWHGLQDVGPMFTSPLQAHQTSRVPQVMYPASQAVVAEARRQLGALFGTRWVPEPILTSYRLWDGDDDFEFAYHQWRTGVDDGAVRSYLAQPFDGLHLCNEAISDMHGWVNGSLRSCDLALAHFGIEPMDGDPCPAPDATHPGAARVTGPHGL